MNDEMRYAYYQQQKQKEHESLCTRCGGCCGVFEDDPCIHLQKQGPEYCCAIYEQRFGIHHTINGNAFRCVPIERLLERSWIGDFRCAYKKQYKGCHV